MSPEAAHELDVGIGTTDSRSALLFGRILDRETGAPILGARVVLVMTWGLAEARTDPSGRFFFHHLPARSFGLDVHVAGHRSEIVTFQVGGSAGAMDLGTITLAAHSGVVAMPADLTTETEELDLPDYAALAAVAV